MTSIAKTGFSRYYFLMMNKLRYGLNLLFLLIKADLQIRWTILTQSIPKARTTVDKLIKVLVSNIFTSAERFLNYTIHKDFSATPELPENFAIISNHQSLIDIPLFDYVFQDHYLRYAGKESLFKYIPVVSPRLRLQRHAKISRTGKVAETMKSLRNLGRLTDEARVCLVIFPEGTRSRDGSVGKFHAGGLKRMIEYKSLPLVVTAVDGATDTLDVDGIISNVSGSSYKIKTLAVLPAPQSRQEIDEAVATARELIVQQVNEWRKQ